MPIEFYYDWNWLISIWAWIWLILQITTYIFLVIGSFDLKKDERKFESANVLSILGIILLTWRIINIFIPSVRTISPTPLDIINGFTYDLIVYSIYGALQLTLGISFSTFGSNNKEHSGRIILIAGILYAVAWGFNITLSILIRVDIWLDPPYFSIPYGIFINVLLVINIILLNAALLILIFSILSRRVFIIIFAALNLGIRTLYLLDLFYPGLFY